MAEVDKFPNGTVKVDRVAKSDPKLSWYPCSRSDVITIDFGTSTLAVAYRVGDGQVKDLPIQRSERNVPSVLIIKPDRKTGLFVTDIGINALEQYSKQMSDISKCVFFNKVKLELQHNQDVNRTSSVKGSDGKKYYLVEVIGLILKNLKEIIERYFETRGGLCKIEEFDWVITVPALWGERARDMMREAAYVAGLCSNIPKWNELLKLPLQTVETHEPMQVKEFECNPERLSLVFEPEAAATWCKHLTSDSVRDCGEATGLLTTDGCFLTVDIGGGTIDVTAHQVERDGRMKVYNLPCGKICGGTTVNQAFRTFLGKEIVHDEAFTKYLSGNDGFMRDAELLGLLDDKFEETKKEFADSSSNDTNYYAVEMPPSFLTIYEDELQTFKQKSIDDGDDVEYDECGGQLCVSERVMQNLFAYCLEEIKQCTDETMDAIGKRVDIIYLVGGFGGCRYIAEHMRLHYHGKVIVIIPVEQELAVVRGACLQHRDGVLREADATYGIGTNVPFDELNHIHRNGEQYIDSDGRRWCANLFQPYIQIHDGLDPDHVYITTFTGSANKTILRVNLYSTLKTTVHYIRDQNGSKPHSLRHLGWLNIEHNVKLADGKDLHWSKRRLEVVLDFSSIEILVHARFVDNGKRVKASADFLSTLKKIENLR